MQIQDSDFYFDFSGEPDTNPWTQTGFTVDGVASVGITSGMLYNSSVEPQAIWRFSSWPDATEGEAKFTLGNFSVSAQTASVGFLDASGNGYILTLVPSGANRAIRFFKYTGGVSSTLDTQYQSVRQYVAGDQLSLRIEIIEGDVHLEFCLNGNSVKMLVDSSSPHVTGLKPVWILTATRISAIGIDSKIVRPSYTEFAVGLSTGDWSEGTIKDNTTRSPISAPFNDYQGVSFVVEYGDQLLDFSVPMRSPDGSAVNIDCAPYKLTAGVPDIRSAVLTVTTSNTVSDWVDATYSQPLDLSLFAGESVAPAAAQQVADSATAFVRQGVADGFSAAGVVPSPFGTATPFSSGPNIANCPNVVMLIKRQVWPSEADKTVFKIDSMKISAKKIFSKKISAQKL